MPRPSGGPSAISGHSKAESDYYTGAPRRPDVILGCIPVFVRRWGAAPWREFV